MNWKRVAVLALGVLLLVSAGCKKAPEPKVQPKVKPPAVVEAGVLKAGIDLSTPPFGGTDLGRKAGIDVDVAAAVADKLGLTIEYVDVKPSDAATALAEGKIDVALSMPFTGLDSSRVSAAGTYIDDAPVVFASTDGSISADTSVTLDSLPAGKIGAQVGSPSYWLLRSEVGSDSIEPFESLREALEALSENKVPLVAGDALVGAYIAKDMKNLRYAGQLATASPYAVVTKADNSPLTDAVRTALDELDADGVLASVRRKWVGDLPKLEVAQEGDAGSESP